MSAKQQRETTVDAVIVGAGFSGLYLLHRFRKLGLTTRVLERGGGVGGDVDDSRRRRERQLGARPPLQPPFELAHAAAAAAAAPVGGVGSSEDGGGGEAWGWASARALEELRSRLAIACCSVPTVSSNAAAAVAVSVTSPSGHMCAIALAFTSSRRSSSPRNSASTSTRLHRPRSWAGSTTVLERIYERQQAKASGSASTKIGSVALASSFQRINSDRK